MDYQRFLLIPGILFIFLIAGCAGSGPFSGYSYDPPGVTDTRDKEISPQHKRTIGISDSGIWLSNEFEGARMNDFYRVNDSLYRAIIKPENYPINNSPWYAFKIKADSGQTIFLELQYEHGEHRYFPKISKDRLSWTALDSSSVVTDTAAGTATLELDLDSKPLWVSAQEIVTGQTVESWIDSLAGRHRFVKRDTIGYSHQNNPIHRLTITQTHKRQKRGVVIITSRQHPPEVTGQLASFIFMEELASDSDLAEEFRKRFEVIAYPLANPDGINNGHWRHNAGGVDLNRDWEPFNQPETQAMRDDLIRLKNDPWSRVYYGIDFHSTNENLLYPITEDIERFPGPFTFRWINALKEEFPAETFAVEPFEPNSPIAKNWIYHTFGADAVTYEVDDAADRELLEDMARTGARLMMEMLLEEMKRYKEAEN